MAIENNYENQNEIPVLLVKKKNLGLSQLASWINSWVLASFYAPIRERSSLKMVKKT
jgi:hypothetical protein